MGISNPVSIQQNSKKKSKKYERNIKCEVRARLSEIIREILTRGSHPKGKNR